MKKLYPKQQCFFKLCIVLLIAVVAVIYGCRKDISKPGDNPTATITDPKIAKAKSWYETNYSKPGVKPSSQNTNAVGDDFDLSQFFSPDWTAAKNYTRFNDDVIEMPVDAASAIGLKVGSASQSNSRSSVLILKRGDTYKAYVMTIVGYPEYLNADTSKLANNSYGKHDANFSGMVYYTTPQGEFVDGYTYKNGVIKGQLVDNYTATTTGGQAIQSITPNSYQAIQVCTAWYQKVGEVWVYLDTQCHTEVIEVPDPSTPLPPITPPSSGGGGGGDSPGNPNPDCPPGSTIQSVKGGNVINTLKIMLRPPGDGGFPPPGGGDNPCTIKPVEDPCDKIKRQKANADLKSQLTDLKNKLNLNYEAGYVKLSNSAPQYITGTPNTLSWNAPQLATIVNGSMEYINHNHYTAPQSLSTFSEDDIKAFYQYIHYNKVVNENTFTFSVVTSQGMSYSLVLNDKQKFDSFYNTYFSDAIGQNLFNGLYNSYISATNSPTTNEANLLSMVNLLNMGVSVMKGNTDFSNWVVSSYDPITNTITFKNCN
ncbi:hypothetical protein IDJ75_17060 [Mucilaginibacter rigui]|uniref:Uncharacterized protein n=1 Tax=Mucilaginibacter rigui TaxID=534635 RepID=A0ABR7X8X5_9SPHI|nr:hypothetical protein [Mucilaginibacter rigui]MBD1386999.1 hypothetical protein [Mucilaginibacter rigui]